MDIKNKIKFQLKKVFSNLGIEVTKNMRYDRLTTLIIKNELTITSNCLDIGCHKGEILDQILSVSKKGKHYGFEPIPHLYDNLIKKYTNQVTILPFALSNKEEVSEFKIIKNSLGYSGLKLREYNVKNPIIETVNVEVKKLDSILPNDYKIDVIKIDVEGAEYDELEGGFQVLSKNKPLIIFEFGKGASEYYNSTPTMMFEIIKKIGLKIFSLENFISKRNSLSLKEFEKIYNEGTDHYFVASI
ncbi:FkbM family methyltransferase [Aureibaculum luteum]|uniref:FkbM family methyltransferase n=1 Tax=Aureibaculum luteum TaxID=1548456 RepID=UPI000E489A78|nr:FkbM family methyltransferase [Aureibaculum luteum]